MVSESLMTMYIVILYIFLKSFHSPSPYVYLPFGIGHRTCIGKVFSMVRFFHDKIINIFQFIYLSHNKMEAKVVMVHLLRTYHLSLPEDYKLEIDHAVTIHPKRLPCSLVPRK